MPLIILGFILFVIPHFFSSLMPGPRDRLMARFGEGRYKGVYSAVTGLGLILLILAYFIGRGSGEMLYAPTGALKHATLGLATLGWIILASAHGKSHIKLWVQNPMSVGIALWSIAHLLVVGKLAVDGFYLALLAVALVDIAVSMARGKTPDFQPRWRSDIIAIVVGLVLTAVFILLLHPYVFGVKVVG